LASLGEEKGQESSGFTRQTSGVWSVGRQAGAKL
jgi:hypothetical protein